MVADVDEIRHANVSATTLPVGTVIEFWGLKTTETASISEE